MDKHKKDIKVIPSMIILGGIVFYVIWGFNNAYTL